MHINTRDCADIQITFRKMQTKQGQARPKPKNNYGVQDFAGIRRMMRTSRIFITCKPDECLRHTVPITSVAFNNCELFRAPIIPIWARSKVFLGILTREGTKQDCAQ